MDSSSREMNLKQPLSGQWRCLSWVLIEPEALMTPVIFLFVYLMGWVNRYGDSKKVW